MPELRVILLFQVVRGLPPVHPTRRSDASLHTMPQTCQDLYLLVMANFLASTDADAVAKQTIVTISIGREEVRIFCTFFIKFYSNLKPSPSALAERR